MYIFAGFQEQTLPFTTYAGNQEEDLLVGTSAATFLEPKKIGNYVVR